MLIIGACVTMSVQSLVQFEEIQVDVYTNILSL